MKLLGGTFDCPTFVRALSNLQKLCSFKPRKPNKPYKFGYTDQIGNYQVGVLQPSIVTIPYLECFKVTMSLVAVFSSIILISAFKEMC
jgi:hypothetical protein